MSDFGLNTTLGREVNAYESAVNRYRQKIDRYNNLPVSGGKRILGYEKKTFTNSDGRTITRDVAIAAPSVNEIERGAPKDPFKGQTQQAIGEAMQQPGIADYVRDADGMIAAALGRKPNE